LDWNSSFMLSFLELVSGLTTPAIHPARAAQIAAINANSSLTWRAAANARFAFQPPGASRSSNGVLGDWAADIRAAVARGDVAHYVPADATLALPESFDSEEHWKECAKVIGDIRDQSNCGCCWAFAGAEAASDRMCIATGGKMVVPLSAQDVCFCGGGLFSRGCDGGQITTPWEYIKRTGAVTGGQFKGSGPFGQGLCADYSLPHCHHHGPQGDDPYPAEGAPGCPSEHSPTCPKRCDDGSAKGHDVWDDDKILFDGEVQTASGEQAIMKMIYEGGPVETAFSVYSDFENYDGGIYKHTSGSMAGGHAVKMVGWGEEGGVKFWKVANSWNPYWGEKGYFRIVRGVNEGGIEDQVVGSAASSKWGTKEQLAKQAFSPPAVAAA